MSTDSPVRHAFDERPWGRFDQYTHNQRSTVKVLSVAPGQRLSLQRHTHRGELWVILDGPMDITVGERTWLAQPGEQIWIPTGTVHRMGNPGDVLARVLEIAHGEFDEDDIERLEDDYSR